MLDPELTIKLQLHEVNCILEALGAQPYREVFELIAKLRSQAVSQIDASAPDPEAPGDATASFVESP